MPNREMGEGDKEGRKREARSRMGIVVTGFVHLACHIIGLK